MSSSPSSSIGDKPRRRSHKNAPLTPEGRQRLIERCRTRPIAHVAAEMGISRATASKWVNRYHQFGELGLLDRSSTPARQPGATTGETVARIEELRREHKWSASRIAFELHGDGVAVSRRTVTRHLAQLGLNRRRFIDPSGETNREVKTITAKHPGHMVHLDVKKVGRIPDGENPRSTCRIRVSPLRHRRAHPPGVHRVTRERTGRDRRRIPEPRPRLVCYPRHHPDRANHHRQRRLLPFRGVRCRSERRRAPPHEAVHAQAQWESRTLQPHPRRRVPLRKDLDLRRPARESVGNLERAL